MILNSGAFSTSYSHTKCEKPKLFVGEFFPNENDEEGKNGELKRATRNFFKQKERKNKWNEKRQKGKCEKGQQRMRCGKTKAEKEWMHKQKAGK